MWARMYVVWRLRVETPGYLIMCFIVIFREFGIPTPHILSVGIFSEHQTRSKRSAFITFAQAATKSLTNFSWLSSCA